MTHAFPVSVKGVTVQGGRVLLLQNERDEWELPGGKRAGLFAPRTRSRGWPCPTATSAPSPPGSPIPFAPQAPRRAKSARPLSRAGGASEGRDS